VQAVSTDDSILAGLAAQDPTVEVVGPRFTAEPHGLAIKKSSTDFVRFVNAVLDRARADGTWARLYDKWLGGPAPAPPAAKYSD
jgi:polar amino acid transport system substrate-binding protein